jgi:hypothetical protein
MAITLTHTPSATTVTLPDALSWADEYSWSPVLQTKTYTTTGALLIEEATRQTGRPISLEGTQDRTWCTRALVDTLRGWAATANITLQLTLRGVLRTVTFDHERGALQGLPVLFYADSAIESADLYVPTIRLIEV